MKKWGILFIAILIPQVNPKAPPLPVEKIINIRVAFGYKDARPARFVGDRYERVYFVQELMKVCALKTKNLACGFERNEGDSDLFFKKMMLASNETVIVKIKVTSSSAGLDDDENRKNPFQEFLSQQSESNMLKGVSRGDGVIYIGHSRDGGGPDFAPPQMTKDKHVDYDWYQKNQPGMTKLKEALKAPQGSEKRLLALLSCYSGKYFTKETLDGGRRLRLHTVDGLIYYSEALEKGLSEISTYIRKRLTAAAA